MTRTRRQSHSESHRDRIIRPAQLVSPSSPSPADILRRMGSISLPDGANDTTLSTDERFVLAVTRVLAHQPPVTHVRPQDLVLPTTSAAVPQSRTPHNLATPPLPHVRPQDLCRPPSAAPPVQTPEKSSSLSSSQPTVRRSARLRTPAPLSRKPDNRRRYSVPLPDGTDPNFKIEIRAGGQIGVNVHCKGILTEVPLNSVYAKTVDSDILDMCLDSALPGPVVWAQRAFFACEKPPRDGMLNPSAKQPVTKYTAGHLLTLLAQKQYTNWLHCYMGQMDLQDAVGPQLIARRGFKVPSDALYIVAIRRRYTEGEVWCYFPELEVRV
ncbi:hypothetical protein OH77DRAFT_1422035 [Trametes cingulata]|nr:hypothetical protein OH77DRAFT_1422035 [Trametes cingulata]